MSDEHCRRQALDPTGSFIVQAPAGSGKTELLTQRFLKLLACVEKAPEEIVAVTFTRKAASQMRSRIIAALQVALNEIIPPSKPHERTTWELANEVLKRDKLLGWDLLLHPNRLRIVTIDSLCAYIVNRMPVLSHLGGVPEIAEFPTAYYRQAVERLLTQTTFQERWSQALSKLLGHQDNRIQMISELLVNMLKKRDQWLPYLGRLTSQHMAIEEYLSEVLSKIIESHLTLLREQFSDQAQEELLRLVRHAAQVCGEQAIDNPIIACGSLEYFPPTSADSLKYWIIIAEFLTTQQNTWRKSFNQKNGFLSPSEAKNKNEKALRKAQKEAMAALINVLENNDNLLPLLAETKSLPSPEIDKEQLDVLVALGELLPVLVAHLQVIFQETGKVDFIEINLRATEALGDELLPSDIALNLDYQLRHLLIDEYQDTSVTQYRLFEKLVTGWQKGDGRTLFLVGDPMQSIYKFRGAEVSLFIHTQQYGIGAIALTPITLQVNFRSSDNIVSWLNKTFVNIFPLYDDKSLGGVRYSSAIASKPSNVENAVNFHPVFDDQNHAKTVIDLVMSNFLTHPKQSIAILVRAKKHLAEIIQYLRPLKIPFVAYEVEHLVNRSHIIDLISLLKAITNWSDIISWYGVLRAPWLGLTLADLLTLSKENQTGILWETLNRFEEIKKISTDGYSRLSRFVPLMRYWLNQRSRSDLHQFLRGLWISLGGPHCYAEPQFINDIDKVLELVKSFTIGGTTLDVEDFEQRLFELYADVTPFTNESMPEEQVLGGVELMTIHKAKGLEFDTVIMPHLEKRPISHELALLLWYEHTHENGLDLILAPRRKHQSEHDSLYQYVEKQLRKKSQYEAARLLYVGATRAKNTLHLVGHCERENDDEIKPPSSSTFLGMLWSHLTFENLPERVAINETPITLAIANSTERRFTLKRLSNNYRLPFKIQQRIETHMNKVATNELNMPSDTDILFRNAGTVFHRLLQRWANEEHEMIDDSCVLALKRMGLMGQDLDKAVALVTTGLHNMLNDPKGRWILDRNHQQRCSEWRVSLKTFQGIENHIIDLSFVDETDTRWIIDYKLTHGTLDEVDLQQEVEKYLGQLQKYQRTLKVMEKRNVKCGLYFPVAKKWWEMP